jgi:tetratricopeptide (TPR) repeat protein
MRGYLPEARERAERVLALADAGTPTESRLRALDAAGGIAYWQGDMERALGWYREEAEVARELQNGKAEAEAIYNQAMSVVIDLDHAAEARALGEEALARFRELGDRSGEGRALWAITNTAIFDASPTDMEPLAEEAIGIFREVGDAFMLAWALYTAALMRIQLAQWDAARADLGEAMSIFGATQDVSGYALVLDGFASLEWRVGDRQRAMRLAGAAAALQDVTGVGLAARNRVVTSFYPEQVTEPDLVAAYAEGKDLSPQEAIRIALHDGESASVESDAP